MKFIIALVKTYSLDLIISEIVKCDSVNIKDWEYADMSIYHKLFLTLLYSISISHISTIKEYLSNMYELQYINSRNNLISHILGHSSKKKLLESSIKTYTNILIDCDNQFIQDVYLMYYDIYSYIKSDDILNDIILFTDILSQFINSDTSIFYGHVNKKLYALMSTIMGNSLITSDHIRYYASEITLILIPIEGFSIFDNLFVDLFKFVNEVNFFKWTKIYIAISHHNKIVQTLMHLLDYSSCDSLSHSKVSEIVISGTLFNLLRQSVEIFEHFTNFCKSITNTFIIPHDEIMVVTNDMLEIIMYTLTIHSDIYQKKIVTNIFPEVEEKYCILIDQLLSATSNPKHELYTIIKRPDLAATINKLVYNSVFKHIDISIDNLYKLKDILLCDTNLNLSGLDSDQQLYIKNIFDNYILNDIEYTDEFLDPLTCNVITNPVKIPDINEIFDKTSILTHIHTTSKNPYTRDVLTIDMLNKYNETEEIVNDIQQFLKKKKDFEDKYTKDKI